MNSDSSQWHFFTRFQIIDNIGAMVSGNYEDLDHTPPQVY
jgi:hypothetical protein